MDQQGRYNVGVKQLIIFTFDMHFDKENDCVQYPLKEMPPHWRRYFITFYFVNSLLLKNKNVDLPYDVDTLIFHQVILCFAYDRRLLIFFSCK